jgi:hypothetical protein
MKTVWSAATVAMVACGPSQESFREDWAAGWCWLERTCPLEEPSGFDLSSAEACEADATAAFDYAIHEDDCFYDTGDAEDLLDRLAEATCAEFRAHPSRFNLYNGISTCDD